MTGRNTVMPSMKFAVCSTINTVPLKTETNIFLLSKWFTRFDTPTPIHLSHSETKTVVHPIKLVVDRLMDTVPLNTNLRVE